MSDVIGLTRELVAIPSHEDEGPVGDVIEGWLRSETDATVRRDDVGNIIARRGSGEPSLGLIGHHDVVPPSEAQVDGTNFLVELRDGRLYGRGSADMKGAVAAAMSAFRDANPDHEVVFASFVGEESGGIGAKFAINEGFHVDHAIVGEGSTGYSSAGVTDVAIAHRGRRGSRAIASGRSAHASEPERGENAIYHVFEAIESIRKMEAPTIEVKGKTLNGSIAVTMICGGTAMNVIPDRCEITIDERTIPGKRLPLEQLNQVKGIEWEIDQDLPPMDCDDIGFAEAVFATAAEVQSGRPEFVTKPHATDAGWLSKAGMSCVVCGPAEPGQAHTATESVDPSVIERCYRIYRTCADMSSDNIPPKTKSK